MIVGIDLGTTNSLISVWESGQARLIPNSLGEVLTPSCVSVDGDGSILVGRAARDRLQTHPDRSAATFKRHMGSDKTFRLGGKSFRAEELSALVLRALREDAEAALGVPVSEAIITVPAYFSDTQRQATRTAGRLAGLKVDRLLNEPTAAALAYGIHQRGSDARFLVFDLGGGTFDVSVLELFDDVMEVRASAGDNLLGGEDVVHLLVEHFFDAAGVPRELKTDARFMQKLHAQAELAKRRLSSFPDARMQVATHQAEYVLDLDETLLERCCEPLLMRLRDPVERALRDAGLRALDLDNVVLAGGATRMPLVRRMAARMFGRFPACEINPDEVVALGAAVQAGLQSRDAALNEVVMTDVSPYSLGVETTQQHEGGVMSHGHFDPIIERNSTVPVSRVKRYTAVNKDQRTINIRIFQGEARMAADNIALGKLTVPLPAGGESHQEVDIRFTYDINGLLEVQAKVVETGEIYQLIIEGNPGLMSEQEIEQRLAALSALKIHPRENAESRALLARAERIYQMLRGTQRERFGDAIWKFEQALDTQDKREVARAARDFQGVVDDMERSSYTLLDEPAE